MSKQLLFYIAFILIYHYKWWEKDPLEDKIPKEEKIILEGLSKIL